MKRKKKPKDTEKAREENPFDIELPKREPLLSRIRGMIPRFSMPKPKTLHHVPLLGKLKSGLAVIYFVSCTITGITLLPQPIGWFILGISLIMVDYLYQRRNRNL